MIRCYLETVQMSPRSQVLSLPQLTRDACQCWANPLACQSGLSIEKIRKAVKNCFYYRLLSSSIVSNPSQIISSDSSDWSDSSAWGFGRSSSRRRGSDAGQLWNQKFPPRWTQHHLHLGLQMTPDSSHSQYPQNSQCRNSDSQRFPEFSMVFLLPEGAWRYEPQYVSDPSKSYAGQV